MQIDFELRRRSHRYRMYAGDYSWGYPSALRDDDVCAMMTSLCGTSYGDPPSHELRTLIEAAAPWYVVIDKLIEEYPQWQSHFEAAAAAERQRMEVV